MIRESYTAAEWRTLQMSFFWIYLAIARADGKIDQKETEAFVSEMRKWLLSVDPLVREVTTTFTLEANGIANEVMLDGRSPVQGLLEVAEILDRKATPVQTKEFKGTLLLVGHRIAKASGGGVFGLGDKISPEERTVLQVLMVALRATSLLQT